MDLISIKNDHTFLIQECQIFKNTIPKFEAERTLGHTKLKVKKTCQILVLPCAL